MFSTKVFEKTVYWVIYTCHPIICVLKKTYTYGKILQSAWYYNNQESCWILFSDDCIWPLSYGHCDVQVTKNESYTLADLQRKPLRKTVVTNYYNYTQNDAKQIKKSTRHETLNLITACNQSVLSLVDFSSTISGDSTSGRLFVNHWDVPFTW